MTFNTPPTMAIGPGPRLTSLAAILGFPAATAFGEFTRLGFPLSTVHVGAATGTTFCFVLATGVTHDDTSPVLNWIWM